MTTKSILTYLLLLISSISIGQKPIGQIKQSQILSFKDEQTLPTDPIEIRRLTNDIKGLCTDLADAPYIWKGKKPKYDNLVSNYSFRKLIKNNFSTLILGNDNISKIGRFATLDIADDNSFSFSPFTWESNTQKSNYQNILALNFSGNLNDEKIAKLSEYRDLSASISYTRILGCTNYKTISRNIDSIKKIFTTCLLKEPLEELCKKYDKLLKDNSCNTADKKEKVYNDFVEEYAELETKLTNEFWGKKQFWWMSAALKFWGRDNVRYLYKQLLDANNYTPKDEIIFTPGLSLGLNRFSKNSKRQGSLLISFATEINRKHSLSDVFEPESFQPFHKVNDSLIQLKSLESVFITNFESLQQKWVFDFGIRAVKMLDISSISRKRQVGFSFSFARKGLVNDKKFPSLFRTEAGLVIPFLKSDNESTFNLEIFHRWDTFSDFSSDNDKFWGIRFNVPLSNR